MYLQNFGIPKTWLGKYLKSVVLQHPSTSNMIKRAQTLLKYVLRNLYHIDG